MDATRRTSFVFLSLSKETSVLSESPSVFRAFNETNHYQREEEGPIEEDTIVVLDSKTGQLLASWGGSLFYMPHGITIDHNNSIW